MSAIEGKMLACDVCGKSLFLKYVGERQADGGFTKWREYENVEGWSSIHFGKLQLANLCPSCYELLQNALLECVDDIRANRP